MQTRKTRFMVLWNKNCFSKRYTRIGAKKKYKAHNSKYVWPILKYVRHIFCLLKTRSKSTLKPQTNKDTRILHLKMRGKTGKNTVMKSEPFFCTKTGVVFSAARQWQNPGAAGYKDSIAIDTGNGIFICLTVWRECRRFRSIYRQNSLPRRLFSRLRL